MSSSPLQQGQQEDKDESSSSAHDLRSLSLSTEAEDPHFHGDSSDDMKSLLEEESNRADGAAKRRRNRMEIIRSNRSFLPSIILQRRLITLRSTLLALSLTLTLAVFWLLDSLKDPTLTVLVHGNLQKHQPLAKMASVGGTLVLVLLMEFISHEREKRRARERLRKRMADDEVLDGGGQWTRMNVGYSVQQGTMNDDIDDGDDNDQIPIHIFQTVGLSYIAAFGIISYMLRYHHGFLGEDTPAPDSSTKTAWRILGYIQYVTVESFGSIGVATFWSFVNSTLTLKAAKTYYGFIIAMAQVGAFGGSSVATIKGISIPNLYVCACFGILLQIGVMKLYGKRFPNAMDEEDDEAIEDLSSDFVRYDEDVAMRDKDSFRNGGRIKRKMKQQHQQQAIEPKESKEAMSLEVCMSGVYLILKHNYLLLILGVSCLYEVSLTCLDYEMKLIGLDRFRPPPDFYEDGSIPDHIDIDPNTKMNEQEANAFTVFMGRYGQLTNVLSLLLSYFAFPYLMEHYGLKHTLRIFPTLLLAISTMTFVALPMNLPVLFVSMSLLKALTYSINDPAKEILYIPTTNTVKFKAKFWIDVVGARVAKAIGSSINTYAGTAARIVQYGSVPSMVTALALWVICYAAGLEFDSLLEKGEVVGSDDEGITKDSMFYEGMDDDDSDDEEGISFDESGGSEEDGDESESQSDWRSDASIELRTFK